MNAFVLIIKDWWKIWKLDPLLVPTVMLKLGKDQPQK